MIQAKHKDQRVAIFVDIQNMYYSAKNLYNNKVDFAKVLKEGLAGRKLVRAFAYVIKADVGSENEFFTALEQRGFEVREKELQTFIDGSNKGDWDVGLCMDAVRMMPKIDVMILVSGDGDYVDLLDYARSQGVRTEVMFFKKTASKKLADEADETIDMSETPGKYLISKRVYSPKPYNGKNSQPNFSIAQSSASESTPPQHDQNSEQKVLYEDVPKN